MKAEHFKTMSAPIKPNRHAVWICSIVLSAFLFVLLNWRSPIAVRSFSPNADLLAFLLAVTALPIALFWYARWLRSTWRRITRAAALCMLMFGALVWLWNYQTLRLMTRGFDVEPLLTSVPFGVGRIAAYEVETTPAGAYVSLRLQYRIVPGILLSREFAVISTPNLNELAVLSPRQLCVAFTALRGDLTGRRDELEVLVPIAPFIGRDVRNVNETDAVPSGNDSANCTHTVT